MRDRKPWYRRARGAWYVQIDGRQVMLAKGPRAATRVEAFERFHRIMAERPRDRKPGERLSFAALAARYALEMIARRDRGEIEAVTASDVKQRLSDFGLRYGTIPAEEIRQHHITEWLAAHPEWGPTARNNRAAQIKAITRWGEAQGLIDRDPIRSMKLPSRKVRREIDPDIGVTAILDLIERIDGPGARDALLLLWLTGARPKEVREIEAKWIDWPRCMVVIPPDRHKTGRKTGRPRLIPLPWPALLICRRWADLHPDGPILRNQRGRPWTGKALNLAIYRARDEGADPRVFAYAIRHIYATEAVERTGDIAGVAAVLGHTSTDMVARIYSHAGERLDYLRGVAERITALPGPASSRPDRPDAEPEPPSPSPDQPPIREDDQADESRPGTPPDRPGDHDPQT